MRFAWPLVAVCLAIGCAPPLKTYPPPPPCSLDGGASCIGIVGGAAAGVGGGEGAGGGATGTGGATAVAELTGTVHRILSPAFDDQAMVTFTGAATILAPGPSGDVSAMYGGTLSTTFDLMGVSRGDVWVLVQDGSGGGAGILSTFSPVSLPSVAPVVLPVVDAAMLQNIASELPSLAATGVSTLAAQVVIQVLHNDAPFQNIAITGGAGSATVVYDIGPGQYSDSATATGAGGTIILFNAGITGVRTITLTDTVAMKSFDVSINAAAGAATLATVDL